MNCPTCGQEIQEVRLGRICGRCGKQIKKHEFYHYENSVVMHDDCTNPTEKLVSEQVLMEEIR